MSKPNPKGRRSPDNSYLKYSGMAFQMIAIMLFCTFIGYWLDGYFGTSPLLIVGFSLVGVFAGLYVSLKDFI